ncbi:DUF4175 family protein [Gemmatimonas phototrophica]|uniref:DUF4175 family protein n=1 Tax=Gemmatimonas phototrophica TaxID=1379270 RepID=UPI000AB9D3AB|nr:DUF4175 family protein [Gemmatimonas phototrophica]
MSAAIRPHAGASQHELLSRIEQLRGALHVLRRGRLLLICLCVALVVVVVGRALTVVLPAGAWSSWPALWLVGSAAAVAVYWWRREAAPDLVRSALWVEEQQGTRPDFALTTAVEMLAAHQEVPESLSRAATASLNAAPITAAVAAQRRAAWRGPAAFALLTALVLVSGLFLPVPRTGAGTQASGTAATTLAGASSTVPALGAWQVRVQPPAYTGLPTLALGDINSVAVLSGSRVLLQGRGDAPTANLQQVGTDSTQVADTAPPVKSSQGGWETSVQATDAPLTLRLSRGGRTRLLVIEGRPDSVPTVTLDAPARDSVFREPVGVIPLQATLRDDIGLARANFELIVSSGEGERFTVRTVTLGAMQWSKSPLMPRATLRGSLNLASLSLLPGDVVHLRAIARDAHPGAQREYGSSETRAFRIARPTEYDSVAVEPAPPPEVDKSLLSQRMLLLLTEKLDKAQRRLARPEVLRESLKLARDQARLRLAVGDVVFQRLSGESSAEHAHSAGDGHDHGVDLQGGKLSMSTSSTTGMLEEGNDSPVIAINQPLLEAYNAMWDAGRALEQGDPHGAIPPMKRALEAIERSRVASRLYLRGKPPQVIVDIAKVRLAGKDTGQVTRRSVREPLPSRLAARDARLVRVAQLATRDVNAARDSLALLRAEALADAPAFASALSRVLDALTAGGDVTAAFVEARRVLGNVVRTPGSVWSRGTVP